MRPKGGDQGEIADVRGSQFEKNSRYDGYGREGICPEASKGWKNASTPRCPGFPHWSKEHWEPCRQGFANRSMITGHRRRKVLDYLLV